MEAARNPDLDPGAAQRLAQGREIASQPKAIEVVGENEWSVPSQSTLKRYRVRLQDDFWNCTCRDFAARDGLPCKHIFAVVELLRADLRTQSPESYSPPRKQYPQHPSYTKAQEGEMRLVDQLLRELVATVPDFPRKPRARGPVPSPLQDDLYCAILKVYSGLSARRAAGVLKNVADRGLLDRVPSHVVSSVLLTRPEVTPVLYRLLTLSALPLAALEDGGVVAPDSTGVQTTSFGGWREEKHGEKRQRRWLKVHAMVGTKTHVVIQAIVDGENSGDSPKFRPLVLGTLENGFQPSTVVADKGYLSHANYRLGDELGLEVFIPFKITSMNRPRRQPSPLAWRKRFHQFQANLEEFQRNYHKRSNVEAVFSAIKRKFGESIRSRQPVAQVNEIICKLIAYNLTVIVHEMFENGIDPSFVTPTQNAS